LGKKPHGGVGRATIHVNESVTMSSEVRPLVVLVRAYGDPEAIKVIGQVCQRGERGWTERKAKAKQSEILEALATECEQRGAG
jgi:hypothetical protein